MNHLIRIKKGMNYYEEEMSCSHKSGQHSPLSADATDLQCCQLRDFRREKFLWLLVTRPRSNNDDNARCRMTVIDTQAKTALSAIIK